MRATAAVPEPWLCVPSRLPPAPPCTCPQRQGPPPRPRHEARRQAAGVPLPQAKHPHHRVRHRGTLSHGARPVKPRRAVLRACPGVACATPWLDLTCCSGRTTASCITCKLTSWASATRRTSARSATSTGAPSTADRGVAAHRQATLGLRGTGDIGGHDVVSITHVCNSMDLSARGSRTSCVVRNLPFPSHG